MKRRYWYFSIVHLCNERALSEMRAANKMESIYHKKSRTYDLKCIDMMCIERVLLENSSPSSLNRKWLLLSESALKEAAPAKPSIPSWTIERPVINAKRQLLRQGCGASTSNSVLNRILFRLKASFPLVLLNTNSPPIQLAQIDERLKGADLKHCLTQQLYCRSCRNPVFFHWISVFFCYVDDFVRARRRTAMCVQLWFGKLWATLNRSVTTFFFSPGRRIRNKTDNAVNLCYRDWDENENATSPVLHEPHSRDECIAIPCFVSCYIWRIDDCWQPKEITMRHYFTASFRRNDWFRSSILNLISSFMHHPLRFRLNFHFHWLNCHLRLSWCRSFCRHWIRSIAVH